MKLRKLEKIIQQTFEITEKTKLNDVCRVKELAYARHAFILLAIYYGFSETSVMNHLGRQRCTCYNSLRQTIQLALQDKVFKRQLFDALMQVKSIEKQEYEKKSNTYKRPDKRVALMRCVVDAVL